MEVKLIQCAQHADAWSRELENHEATTGHEYPEYFLKRLVEPSDVSDSERDDRARELARRDWQLHGICSHWCDPGAFYLLRASPEHRLGEVSADHHAAKSRQPRDLGGHIHCASA